MLLDVSGAVKSPGTVTAVDLIGPLPPIEYGAETLRFPEPVHLTGHLVFTGESIVLRGRFTTVWHTACALCLEEVDLPFDIPFNEEFAKSRDDAHPDRFLYSGDAIDLTEMIQTNLLLNLPIRVTCSEDCGGLCPVCGASRNMKACSCRIDDGGAFSSLSAWNDPLKDNKEV